MSDNDEFKIQLRVADKVYPVFCKRKEEGLFRKAATNINDKLLRYGSRFSGVKFEMRDLLAMVAVHVSVDNLLLKQKEEVSPVFERIELLNKELEAYLQSIRLD